MSTAQHQVSNYLQGEFCHTLGAYRVAEQRLADLSRELRAFDRLSPPGEGNNLLKLVDLVREYNADLGDYRHAAHRDVRHPPPRRFPASDASRFDPARKDGPGLAEAQLLWQSTETRDWITEFYEAAIFELGRPTPAPREDRPFRRSLVLSRDRALAGGSRDDDETEDPDEAWSTDSLTLPDGPSRPPPSGWDDTAVATRRRHRYEARIASAREVLQPTLKAAASRGPGQHRGVAAPAVDQARGLAIVDEIGREHLDLPAPGTLSMYTLNALAEAHLAMHGVEAWRSMAVGRLAGSHAARAWLKAELDRAIALTTFAYCVARSAPWIFAEDQAEAATVFGNVRYAWYHAVPTRCMWIAAQVSLLALHRRGYARGLTAETRRDAYNDFHKVQRHIRDTERRVLTAPIHVEGAADFLTGLDAQAHCHIGELYRASHAHQPALKHFRSAVHRIDQVRREPQMQELLANSRWQVHLQIARGKALYELGRHKEAMKWYLIGWKSFLELLAADTSTEPTLDHVDIAIKWLERRLYEPELRKAEVAQYLTPIVDQLDGISVDSRMGVLASDILLRLGHLLFIVNLPTREGSENSSDDLAMCCLYKAHQCDPNSTLAEADRIKAVLRAGQRDLKLARRDAPVPRTSLPSQWPGGGADYERVARLTELALLRAARDHKDDARGPVANLAYRVLLDVFAHTDSADVRKSQAHLNLMLEQNREQPPRRDGTPAIEFICARRYSSAFPLLPKPSAFRSLMGGYLVRLHAESEADPCCIAVDPGPGFVENLYRVGLSIADLQMIVITHDHVDHMASLDPLLSLLHERSQLMASQREGAERLNGFPIIASRSVLRRYRSVKPLFGPREDGGTPPYQLYDLAKFASRRPPAIFSGALEGFELRAVSTEHVATMTKPRERRGHEDLSGVPSYSLLFTSPGGAQSLAIIGDAPAPPSDEQRLGPFRARYGRLLEADAIVIHLSSVPLGELRALAELEPADLDLTPADEAVGRLAEALGGCDEASFKNADAARRHVEDLKRTVDGMRLAFSCREMPSAELIGGLKGAIGELDGLRSLAESEDLRGVFEAAERVMETLGSVFEDDDQLEKIVQDFSKVHGHLRHRLEYAFWLVPGEGGEVEATSLAGRVDTSWLPPFSHSYLQGTARWADEYKRARKALKPGRQHGLVLLGELSDELGTLRGRIAERLNSYLGWRANNDSGGRADTGDPGATSDTGPGQPPRFAALTSDIGLHVSVHQQQEADESRARVLCTNCNIDNDRVATERFHDPENIREVCVKGENEGIFYNCGDHDPSLQQEKTFLEQLERFDVYGR